MAADGQIVFEVTADGSHIVTDIKNLSRLIDKETMEWDKSTKEATGNMEGSFSSMLKKIGSAISVAAIGKKLLAFGKEALQAASDLQEVQNVVDTTFGQQGAAKIEAWAKKAGSQFGLTETQAKKFSSTIGAMMKSSGLAGDEIVDMSTNLAGLAADMASFYNLDFDTAFQKIRSGISGETEPLKQLGINMSVANLNAYALQQGLSKTFEQMSQGEQTMLRYQYLMSATADAQGDFAKTSDSYANSMRNVQTMVDSVVADIGKMLIPAVEEGMSIITRMIDRLKPSDEKTLLDQVAEIDLDKEAKLREIELLKREADGLIAALEDLGKPVDTSGLDSLTDALTNESVTGDKAKAWNTFLSALNDNAEGVASITGMSADEVSTFLSDLAEAANELDPAKAEGWNALLDRLLTGLPGLADTEEGQKFLEQMATNFLAMGTDSDQATAGLRALGYSTEEIEQKQASWLATCKELAKTIPGLSGIIDTNTGEIKGGIPALKEYADEWARTAKYQAKIEALRKQRELYEQNNDLYSLEASAYAKRARAEVRAEVSGLDEVEAQFDQVEEAIKQFIAKGYNWKDILNVGFDWEKNDVIDWFGISEGLYQKNAQIASGATGVDASVFLNLNQLTGESRDIFLEWAKAYYEFVRTSDELPKILEKYEEEEQSLAEETGQTTEEIEAQTRAAEEAAKAMTTLQKAASGDADALDEVTNAVENTKTALESLSEYYENARSSVEKSVDGIVKGFEKIETPMQKNEKDIKDITDKIEKLDSSSKSYKDDLKKLNDELANSRGAQISAQSMGKNLEAQAKYMEEYLANLRKAREMGVSNEVLAGLSDGSTESYDYLAALANASPDEIEKINAAYEEVSKKKKELTDELTAQQLSVDDVYKTLAEDAKAAVAALDLAGEAKENSGKTVAEMAQGISDHVPDVKEAVDSILKELDRLSAWGISINLGSFGNIPISSTGNGMHTRGEYSFLGSFATGLDFVTRDGFAYIHAGEGILTAEENRAYQNFKNGSGAIDYEAMGGVMRDNIKPGGNVYLDGKVVGSVISARQGRSYKTLQRSGWQA